MIEEYLKRKLSKLSSNDFKINQYPFYYQEGSFLIKETQDGQKFIIEISHDGKEIIKGKLV